MELLGTVRPVGSRLVCSRWHRWDTMYSVSFQHLYWKATEHTFRQHLLKERTAPEKRVTCEVVYCHSSLFELETIVSMTQPTALFLHIQVLVTLKSSILFRLCWGILLTSLPFWPVRLEFPNRVYCYLEICKGFFFRKCHQQIIILSTTLLSPFSATRLRPVSFMV